MRKPKFHKLQRVQNEVKTTVKFLDLASKANSIFEKLFWISIGAIGACWALYFLGFQFVLWEENQFIVTKKKIDLSEIDYPAITICSPASTKYGIVERLRNYMEPRFESSQEFLPFLNLYLKCFVEYSAKKPWGLKDFDVECKEKHQNEACKVGFQFSFLIEVLVLFCIISISILDCLAVDRKCK